MPRSGRLRIDPVLEARGHWEACGWSTAAPGMAAVTSVMRAQQILQARVDAVLRPFDLTFARYELLMLLHLSRAGVLPLTSASSRLQVHPTSVTNAVDRLEHAELVRRKAHPTDGRARLVEISALGRKTALAATEALNAEVFDDLGLPPRRLESLISVLADFRQGAGDF